MPSLTPEQRSQSARLAAHERWARQDGVAGTEKARRNSPGHIDYWIPRVENADTLSDAEVRRRAESLKKAHFTRLAFEASKARARKARR